MINNFLLKKSNGDDLTILLKMGFSRTINNDVVEVLR